MADQSQNPDGIEPEGDGSEQPEPIRFTDRRRVDPETGERRDVGEEPDAGAEPDAESPAEAAAEQDAVKDPLSQAEEVLREAPADSADTAEAAEGEVAVDGEVVSEDEAAEASEEVPATASEREAELQADLQRVQAEYANYRRRMDRDRATDRDRNVGEVIAALLPVLDDIAAARQAGDLEDGPFAAIASKLESTLTQQGLEVIDEVGVPFDPTVHEALMQQPHESIEADHVAAVLRAGYRHGDRVLRAAQVMVSTGPAE
ncbi:nucleotide exchange factor GrpE [Nesterenkonia sp. F]|uniref:nucleotide exchange factor GrpE n=1 Tax=Nesterenkonia sp. F TaxID=795955 RepID=UPI000255D33C|nr:nucleotide exchange factor GrpE [Nesterenkonia sp. F]